MEFMQLFPTWFRALFAVVFVLVNLGFIAILIIRSAEGEIESTYERIELLNGIVKGIKCLAFLIFIFALGLLVNYLIHLGC